MKAGCLCGDAGVWARGADGVSIRSVVGRVHARARGPMPAVRSPMAVRRTSLRDSFVHIGRIVCANDATFEKSRDARAEPRSRPVPALRRVLGWRGTVQISARLGAGSLIWVLSCSLTLSATAPPRVAPGPPRQPDARAIGCARRAAPLRSIQGWPKRSIHMTLAR